MLSSQLQKGVMFPVLVCDITLTLRIIKYVEILVNGLSLSSSSLSSRTCISSSSCGGGGGGLYFCGMGI